MSTENPTGRYSETCGATNRNGEPCGLPAGWGTPGSKKGRCKFHGGCSTGPKDTSHLEGNDFAKENPGGGPPEGNTNAEVHGGFSDWRKVYDRLDEETTAYVDELRDCMRNRAKEHAPEVDADRREELLKERATLSILWKRAAADTVGTPADPVDGARGLVIEETAEVNGESYTRHRMNPAFTAGFRLKSRQRELDRELRLRPAFQTESDDEETSLSVILSE